MILGAGVSGNVSSANLDNVKTNGNYTITGDGWGLLTVEAFNASYIKQIRYYAVDHKTEVRYCTNGTWGNWCNMDAFGCSTASDLASLLGGAMPYGTAVINKGTNRTFAYGKGLYHFWLAGNEECSYYIFIDGSEMIRLNSRWLDDLIIFSNDNGNLNVAVAATYSNLSVCVRKIIHEP